MSEQLDLSQFDGHRPAPWQVYWEHGDLHPINSDDRGMWMSDAKLGRVLELDSGVYSPDVPTLLLLEAAPALLSEVVRLRAEVERLGELARSWHSECLASRGETQYEEGERIKAYTRVIVLEAERDRLAASHASLIKELESVRDWAVVEGKALRQRGVDSISRVLAAARALTQEPK